MRNLILLILFVGLNACSQKKRPLLGETPFQRELNAFYKDASTSPLKAKDLKNFNGLAFFKVDTAYRVHAHFKRTPNETPFKMKTTTNRLPEYVKYGEVMFDLNGESFALNVYQSLELKQNGDYEDYLFLPFLDETNGYESYGGGRYIDLKLPKNDSIVIDFNTAYNPYCAYNDKYSCPVVPRVNYLRTRVEAGVKAFKKH